MDDERYKELQATKEEVKKKNIDAVAELLLSLREQVYDTQTQMTDLRRLTTNVLQEHAQFRAELDMLKAQNYQKMGTGEMGS